MLNVLRLQLDEPPEPARLHLVARVERELGEHDAGACSATQRERLDDDAARLVAAMMDSGEQGDGVLVIRLQCEDSRRIVECFLLAPERELRSGADDHELRIVRVHSQA
jgi:hypothetical protein